MSIYDSVIPPEGTTCPGCSKPLGHFQTHAFGGAGMYRIGDNLIVGDYDDLFIENGWADCISSCDHCKGRIDARMVVVDHRYSGFELTRFEPVES